MDLIAYLPCSVNDGSSDWYGAREGVGADTPVKNEAGGVDWKEGRAGVGADAVSDTGADAGAKIGAGGGVANAGELLPDQDRD